MPARTLRPHDGPASSQCRDRAPPLPRRLAVDLPPLTTLAAIACGQAQVVSAVAGARITPNDGVALSRLIVDAGEVLEAADLEQRIVALERRLPAGGGRKR